MSEYQDTLDPSEDVVDAREHGLRLVRRSREDDPTEWRVEAPGHEDVHFYEDEKRARLFLNLSDVLGGWREDEVGRRGIPLEVALDGRPAIAVYLYSRWDHTVKGVARQLDVQPQAVYDYVSKIRARARDEGDT